MDKRLRIVAALWLHFSCIGIAVSAPPDPLFLNPDSFLEALYDNPAPLLSQVQEWQKSADTPREQVKALLALVDVLTVLDQESDIFNEPRTMREAHAMASRENMEAERIFLDMLLWLNFDQTADPDPKSDERKFEAWLQEAKDFDDLTTRLVINYSGQLVKNGGITKALQILQAEHDRLKTGAKIHPLRYAKFQSRISLVLYKARNFEKSERVDEEIQAFCQKNFYRKFCIENYGNVATNFLRRKDPKEIRKVAELSQKAIAASREIQLPTEEAYALYNLGLMHTALNENTQAASALQSALHIYQKLGNKEWIAACHLELARLAAQTKNYPLVLKEAEAAQLNFPQDYASDLNAVDHLFYEAYRALGREREALEALERYIKNYTKLRDEEKSSSYSQAMVDMGLQIEESRNEALARENQIKQQQIEDQRRIKNLTMLGAGFALLFFLLLLSMVLLRRYTRKIIEHEKQRTTFFHNTSHELRTPLNGMIGFMDLILAGSYGPVPEAARQQMQKVLRLAYSLKQQVNTILDLAKSQRGELQLNARPLDLKALMQEADQLAEGLCLKSPLLQYSSYLEVQGAPSEYCGDGEKIFTILRNLLGNAFKFSRSDQPNHVRLHLTHSSRGLELTVIDQGIGIPKAAQASIFKEFVQVQGDSRRNYEGTGLGLTMVQQLVQLMKGTITLESQEGQGTSVKVLVPPLPVTGALNSAAATEKHDFFRIETKNTAVLVREEKAFGDLILVIDDNEMNCELICDILKADGHRVESAISGRAGLERMRQEKPDLVLLDMMMPEMSGEDVLMTMHKEPELQEIPVILITARASEEDRLLGLRLGAHDYLAKPLITEELRLRVGTVVRQLQLVRKLSELESREKMIHLGELFADLSHEIKNFLQGAQYIPALLRSDAEACLAPLGLPEGLGERVVNAWIQPTREIVREDRLNILSIDLKQLDAMYWESLRLLLSELPLSKEDLSDVWQAILSEGPDARIFLETQLRIWAHYRLLGSVLTKSRELTQSILSYTRASTHEKGSSLLSAWSHVQRLIESRASLAQVRWDLQLRDIALELPEGALMQVLINLAINAIDAVANLPIEQRWIRISSELIGSRGTLSIENGGPPLASEVQSHLFERGFTTKGDRGNGIGLFVSRRLVHSGKGELTYDADASSPRFRLVLPKL